MVGGTNESYDNPDIFQEAWNHPDEEEKEHWRTAIKKEFNDMTKREVWRKANVTGYFIYLNCCLKSWKSRGQKHVTLSSTEAEYVAVSEACTEIMFIKMIMEFLELEVGRPVKVHCDNVGAILMGTIQNRV